MQKYLRLSRVVFQKEFQGEKSVKACARFAKYFWVLPISCIGILLIPFVIASGGTVSRVSGAIEIEGGFLSRLFLWLRLEALTVGHIILGPCRESLTRCRAHEHIHVSQYERWGALFPFLYLASSVIVFVRGQDPYRKNVFEREAFEASQPEETA